VNHSRFTDTSSNNASLFSTHGRLDAVYRLGRSNRNRFWFPAELATCCEHLVNVRVSVNGRGHNGNLLGVQSGDCNGGNLSAAGDFVMQG
jgi:hypothetical protein